MRLCFDATRFGSGLDGAIAIAAERGVHACEFSFAPFNAKGAAGKLDDKERQYLVSIAELGKQKEVEIACLNLDFCLDVDDKKSIKQFVPMVKVRAKLLISFVLEIKYSLKGKEEKRMNEFIWR